MRIPLVFLAAILGLTLCAQKDSLLIQNSRPVETNRYRDIDGSPYYFSDWARGKILRSDALFVEDVLFNYNGYSRELEVKSGDQIYILDKKWHLRADVRPEDNPHLSGQLSGPVIFQQRAHRELGDGYGAILFLGDSISLIQDFHVGKTEKEFNDVGKTIKIVRFKALPTYYLMRHGNLIQLKLQKKKLLEGFPADARLEELMTSEKLDPGKEEHLIRLVSYADTLLREGH